MAKIGIYGGSFNPPHLGHIQAAKSFQEELGLDKLLIIPAAEPPHKQLPSGSPDAQTRLEMVRLAAAELPFAEVDDLELRREGASYTVDTLKELRKRYPDDDLYFCMGTDMFQSFDSWYQPKKIVALSKVAMVHREETDMAQLRELAAAFKKKYGKAPVILHNPLLPMCSTQIRRLLILGGAEDFLPPAVLDFIRERGLYGTGKDRKNLPFEELKRESLALHKESRVKHVIGCSETARELALIHGADPDDAERAGILHDITKALDGDDQLRLCDKYDIMIDAFERAHPKLLHSVTGADVARRVFGENDAVYEAIRWHTSGKANMTTLEKIIYVADYMEPNRDFPGVKKLRELAHTDLDAALLLGLQMTREHLDRQGAEMGRNSIEAMAYLENKKGSCV